MCDYCCVTYKGAKLSTCTMCNGSYCNMHLSGDMCIDCKRTSCSICYTEESTCVRCAECKYYTCEAHLREGLCVSCAYHTSLPITIINHCISCNKRLGYDDREYHRPCLVEIISELLHNEKELIEFRYINHDYGNLIFIDLILWIKRFYKNL